MLVTLQVNQVYMNKTTQLIKCMSNSNIFCKNMIQNFIQVYLYSL